uniref:Retrotransposon Copia-like N-terminal domain-containing protein n=1 Tax=Davidia involucrata TaxID=16924 RepID=A0A5B7BD59_DAVIN
MAQEGASTGSTSSSSSSSSVSVMSSTPIYLLTNVCNLITVKLDSTNYIAWKFQFTSVLRAHNLLGFVDGTHSCPAKFLCDERGIHTTEENPSYNAWITQDQALMAVINATLTPTALSSVIGYKTSRDVWLALERHFSSTSRSNILQLKANLQSLTKGKDTIDQYIQKVKAARDSLAEVSVHIDDEDLLIYTLNGLPSEFNAFRTAIRTRAQPLTLEEMHVLLRAEEQSVEAVFKQNQNQYTPSAMVASSHRAPFYNNRGNNRGRGRGRSNMRGGRFSNSQRFNPQMFNSPNSSQAYGRGQHQFQFSNQSSNQAPNQTPQLFCQICNKPNHSALDCYHRMNYAYQGRHPPSQLAAMAASYGSSQTNPNLWLTDSGATNHVTADFSTLSISDVYQGEDQLSVGNGQGQGFGEDPVPRAQ